MCPFQNNETGTFLSYTIDELKNLDEQTLKNWLKLMREYRTKSDKIKG